MLFYNLINTLNREYICKHYDNTVLFILSRFKNVKRITIYLINILMH